MNSSILKFFKYLLLSLIGLVLLLLLLSQTAFFQNYISDKVIAYVNEMTDSKIKIDRFRWSGFNQVSLDGVFVPDEKGDTLASVGELDVSISFKRLFDTELVFNDISLNDVVVNLDLDKDGKFNYQYLVDAFVDTIAVASDSTANTWEIELNKINAQNLRFTFDDYQTYNFLQSSVNTFSTSIESFDINDQSIGISSIEIIQPVIDYQHSIQPNKLTDRITIDSSVSSPLVIPDIGWAIYIEKSEIEQGNISYQPVEDKKNISGFDPQYFVIEQLNLKTDSLRWNETGIFVDIENLAFGERKSGLALDQLSSKIKFADQGIIVDLLLIKTPKSTIDVSAMANFTTLNDLIDNQDRVVLKADFSKVAISPSDINKIVPNTFPDAYQKPFLLDGRISGLLQNLRFDNIAIRQGNNITFSADGIISGLPNVDDLGFNLYVKQLNTSYQALQPLLPPKSLPPALNDWGAFDLKGQIRGSLDSLYTNDLTLTTASGPQLKGDIAARDITTIDKAYFNLEIDTFITLVDHFKGFVPDTLPAFLDSLGSLRLSGTFKGTTTKFDTDLVLSTAIGKARSDAKFNFNKDYSNATYNGLIVLEKFELGKIVQDTSLGDVTLTTQIDGEGLALGDLDSEIDGVISAFEYNGYAYDSLRIDGSVENSVFQGMAKINDPNLKFDFEGRLPLNDSITEDYRFTLNVDTVNLDQLGLYPEPLGIKLGVQANIDDLQQDNLDGEVLISTLVIADSTNKFISDTIVISSGIGEKREQFIKINTDWITASLEGDYQFSTLPSALSTWANNYFPVSDLLFPDSLGGGIEARPLTPPTPPNADINFSMTLRHPKKLTNIFVPELTRFDSAQVDIVFNSNTQKWQLDGLIPIIKYGTNTIDSIKINSTSTDQKIDLNVGATRMLFGENTTLNNSQLDFLLQNDSIYTIFQSGKKIDTAQWLIGGVFTNNINDILFHFDDPIKVDGNDWQIDPQNTLSFSERQRWLIENFKLTKNKELIEITTQGNLNSKEGDAIVKFRNFDIGALAPILDYPSGFISGRLNGDAEINDLLSDLNYTANLDLKEWRMDSVFIGNLNVLAEQEAARPIIDVKMSLDGSENNIVMNGNYNIDTRVYDIDADVKNLALSTIDPFMVDLIHDSQGDLVGSFKISGTPEEPKVNGQLKMTEVSTIADFVNTRYTVLDGTINLSEQKIDLGRILMKDAKGNSATLRGQFKHELFQDITMDLNFNTNRFQFLNTTAEDNDLFYGSLILKTDVNIKGPVESPRFYIDATTQPGTKFYVVPLTDEQAISQDDYIIFGKPQLDSLGTDTSFNEQYALSAPGVDLELNLTLTDDAELQVIIDPVSGDKLVCKGNADMSVEMNKNGAVNIVGNYVLSEGEYKFSYEIIKREFKILPNSEISFNGDPLAAKLNITSAYETRVMLGDLVESQLSGDQTALASTTRGDVQVQLKIGGNLIEPELSFDIVLDEDERGSMAEAVKARLLQLRTNETSLNTQVFSLILFNSFLPDQGGSSSVAGIGESAALNSVSKLVSNQLNKLAGNAIKGVNINLGVKAYKPGLDSGNEGIATEVELGVSKKLFNDRLNVKVGGNLNVASGNEQQAATAFAGDFALEYQLTKAGNYLLRVYRRSDYDALNQGNINRTGVGVSFKKSFEDKRVKNKTKRKSKE